MENVITETISNFGFPIACCVFMAWYQVKKIDVFTDTMTRNNQLLEALLERLRKDEE